MFDNMLHTFMDAAGSQHWWLQTILLRRQMLCDAAMQVGAQPSNYPAPAAFVAWIEYKVCCCSAAQSQGTASISISQSKQCNLTKADHNMHSSVMWDDRFEMADLGLAWTPAEALWLRW
jgi:hypothetical protein